MDEIMNNEGIAMETAMPVSEVGSSAAINWRKVGIAGAVIVGGIAIFRVIKAKRAKSKVVEADFEESEVDEEYES